MKRLVSHDHRDLGLAHTLPLCLPHSPSSSPDPLCSSCLLFIERFGRGVQAFQAKTKAPFPSLSLHLLHLPPLMAPRQDFKGKNVQTVLCINDNTPQYLQYYSPSLWSDSKAEDTLQDLWLILPMILCWVQSAPVTIRWKRQHNELAVSLVRCDLCEDPAPQQQPITLFIYFFNFQSNQIFPFFSVSMQLFSSPSQFSVIVDRLLFCIVEMLRQLLACYLAVT